MFNFKKKFGQNFLINEHIISAITDYVERYEEIIEIGPGNGSLTKSLISKGKKVTAIDIDKECIDSLKDLNITLIHSDILNYELPTDKVIIGNLPYNISSKIVEKIVFNTVPYAVFMFQKEVGDILTGVKYSKLTIFAQSRYKITKLMDVKPGNFIPVPKVNSQVLVFEKIREYDDIDLVKLQKILFIMFNSRRKMIGHLKKKHLHLYESIISLGIDPKLRAENLTKEKYFELTKIL